MRTQKSTRVARHDTVTRTALCQPRRALGLALVLALLWLPLAVEAGHSRELRSEKDTEIAALPSENTTVGGGLQSVNAEIAQLLGRLERLAGRLAKLEERVNHVVPPPPRVRCSAFGGCWAE
jgi:hypothetical protein